MTLWKNYESTFGNRISLLGMCLLEAMDVDGWTGALLTRGRLRDALRKQRSGFGARTLFLVLPPPPVSDSSILKSKGCSSQSGKTDPVLGRTKKDGGNAKRKRRWREREIFFYISRDNFFFNRAHTLKYVIIVK